MCTTEAEIEADEREEALRERRRLMRDPETGFALMDHFWGDEPEDEEYEEFEND